MPSKEIGPLRNGSALLLDQRVQESCGGLPSAHQLVSSSKCNNLLILPGWGTSWQCSFPLRCCLHSSPSCCPQAVIPADKLLLIAILLLNKALAGATPAWTLRWQIMRNWSPNISALTQPGEQPVTLVADVMWGSLSPWWETRMVSSPMWAWFALSVSLLIMQTLSETCLNGWETKSKLSLPEKYYAHKAI